MDEGTGPRRDERLAAVGSLDDPVRRSLYEFVTRSRDPVGRDEAAQATEIGRPLAAYHLDKLVSLGLLSATYQRPPGRGGPGAGRPAKVYTRSATEFTVSVPPRDYELAANLLAHAVESDAEGTARAELQRAARLLGAEIGRAGHEGRASEASDAESADRTTSACNALMAALSEHGFEPRRDQDGTVVLGNCPFHQLAARYTEVVCGMNLALLDGAIAGLGGQGLRAALDPAPGRCCVVIKTGTDRDSDPQGEL